MLLFDTKFVLGWLAEFAEKLSLRWLGNFFVCGRIVTKFLPILLHDQTRRFAEFRNKIFIFKDLIAKNDLRTLKEPNFSKWRNIYLYMNSIGFRYAMSPLAVQEQYSWSL